MERTRALHFVLKIVDRKESLYFFRDVLGMKVLRHEEFQEGCQASCNGPYDGKWSKTMIGYGDEDSHFVLELTYNYGIGVYEMGNDFHGITIGSKKVWENVKKSNWPIFKTTTDHELIHSPEGYPFFIVNQEEKGDPIKRVSLNVSRLDKAKEFWHEKLQMKIELVSEDALTLYYGQSSEQCRLQLRHIGLPVDHGKACGRIAFSCPKEQLHHLEEKMRSSHEHILKPLISLETPGKTTVQVVILADPDGHEICFVEDEAFRQLSKMDPNAEQLLEEGIEKDKSSDWFEQRGGKLSA